MSFPESVRTRAREHLRNKVSHKDILIFIALELDTRLFVDQYDTPHIRFPVDEIYKTYPLRSNIVKQWLAKLLYDTIEKAPGGEALNATLNVLKAKAREEAQIPLYNRVAPGAGGAIWIDMADYFWRGIYVTKDGWKKVDTPPILFRRFSHQLPLPDPEPGGDVREILEFSNLHNPQHSLLYVVDTVSKFIPEIPHPISYFYGPHGGGKTMVMNAQRSVVDPSRVKLLKLPRNDKELIQQMYHHYLPYYDNLSSMTAWMSDTFCRAVSGTGNSKRQLFSDDEDVIYQYRRCPGVNGINLVATRGDFLDRAILYECGIIDDANRLEDRRLDELLKEKAPRIFGAILDVLVEALSVYSGVELKGLSRMADFHRWGFAIAEAIGYGGDAFLEAYRENIEAQSEETLRASMIAQVVLRFMEGRDEWSGSPTVLLSNLDSTAEGMGFSTNVKGWPKRAYILGRRLNELSPSLRNAGDIVFERGRTSRARQIRLIRAGKTSSGGVIGVMASQAGQERGAGSLESFTMRDSSLRGDLGRLLEEIHKLTLARGEDIVSIGDLGKGLGWDQETFDTVLAAAKRDSVVYEPQPGFLGVLR